MIWGKLEEQIIEWIEDNDNFVGCYHISDSSFSYSYGSINSVHRATETEFVAPDDLKFSMPDFPWFSEETGETYENAEIFLIDLQEMLDTFSCNLTCSAGKISKEE